MQTHGVVSLPRRLFFLMALWTLAGCAQQPGQESVATVGERQIKAEDLREFVLNLLPGLRSEEEGDKAREDYLQSLIDHELLLLEARNQGMDQDPGLLRELGAQKQDHLISIYYKREIRPQAQVTQEEIRQFFDDQGMGRERLLSGIMVATEEEAQKVLTQLQAGRGFADLAREHSLHRRSGEQGGQVGFVNRPTAEGMGIPGAVFDSLRSGVVSPPLPGEDNWQLVRFLQDQSADLETHWAGIRKRLMKEKQQDVEAQKVELLAYELDWRPVPEGLNMLQQGARSLEGKGGLSLEGEQRKKALFTYQGGEVTIDDYLEVLRAHRIKTPNALQDSAFIALVVRRFILRPTMLGVAAERLGIPEEPGFREWIEKEKEELMLKYLRQREVGDKVSVSEEEVRQFYQDNSEKFRLPEIICFDEVITETEEEARKLRVEIDLDTNLLELARARGLPIRKRDADSLICMNKYYNAAYPKLWEALQDAPVGELRGPVPMRDRGYVLFKVARREESQQQPFEQVQKRARATLARRAERQLFDEWILELRARYQDQVKVFADRLAEALPDALLASLAEEL